MRLNSFRCLLAIIFTIGPKSNIIAQKNNAFNGLWTLDMQPLVLLEPFSNGIKIGGEYFISKRTAIHSDFCYRLFTNPFQNLTEGEKDKRFGFQLQPSLRIYVGNHHHLKNKFAQHFLKSFDFRPGFAQYYRERDFWNFMTDGQGNLYQKLLSYTRVQSNYEFTVVYNSRWYFNDHPGNTGIEYFIGMGLKYKHFDYIKYSPELTSERLRNADQGNKFSLAREGFYPMLPIGLRLFYIIN